MKCDSIFFNHSYIHKDKHLFCNDKINLLLSWLENMYVLKNRFLNRYIFAFYSIIFKVCVFKKTVAIFIFNFASFTFFIIISVFTFNFLNYFRKTNDKNLQWACHNFSPITMMVTRNKTGKITWNSALKTIYRVVRRIIKVLKSHNRKKKNCNS